MFFMHIFSIYTVHLYNSSQVPITSQFAKLFVWERAADHSEDCYLSLVIQMRAARVRFVNILCYIITPELISIMNE